MCSTVSHSDPTNGVHDRVASPRSTSPARCGPTRTRRRARRRRCKKHVPYSVAIFMVFSPPPPPLIVGAAPARGRYLSVPGKTWALGLGLDRRRSRPTGHPKSPWCLTDASTCTGFQQLCRWQDFLRCYFSSAKFLTLAAVSSFSNFKST